ncbi:MAG: AmmeMemoRadiSam system radical SAM enzyme [Candidatus Cloacimonetes bacterium]|nr:AmmeMemoRadiSam system radical SAM enzyme [Candidatus Cloacimonadota bacterium]
MREALYFSKEGTSVRCELCPRMCLIAEGETGYCRGRKVVNGVLIADNYAKCASISIDPIEKKPLYHFNPGSSILSLGPNSCNLGCLFCQNWSISQTECSIKLLSVEELVSTLTKHDLTQVAFTYTEPLMWYEYIWDFAKLTGGKIDIVLVTNGYLNEQPFKDIVPHITAMNIDLKSINSEFYRQVCGGDVEVIKRNIQIAYQAGIHVEITNLLIPGYNDSASEIEDLAKFIASIDRNITLHISAYHPDFKFSAHATKASEIEHACDIAAKYLSRVYAGNVQIPKYSLNRC